MRQKIAFALALMTIVALVVWFVPGAAETVEGLIFDSLNALLY
jgi:hypothetical protein